MAHIERIRWLHFQAGWSIRKIARHVGIARQTVTKYIGESQPPRYNRSEPYVSPTLEPYKAQIEQLLREDEYQPKKKRHTARRIYQRLKDECGYTGSESTVRRHVASLRRKPPPVFIPFGVRGGGSRRGRLCVPAFPQQRQKAFFEGIRRAWEFYGGVPLRLILDNLKQALRKVLEGRNRLEQDNFPFVRTACSTAPFATRRPGGRRAPLSIWWALPGGTSSCRCPERRPMTS